MAARPACWPTPPSSAPRTPRSGASNDRLVREPGSRYIDFLVPGLLGMNLMGSAIWGMGFAIVDARRKKLIKRLIATPMPRQYYLLSFLLSRLALLAIEVFAVAGFGHFVFGVPVRGSAASLGALCVLGSLSFSALGLLIASRARTIEAASGLMNVTMMPMWIVSGVFFSSERFPAALQPVIQALPLTAAIDACGPTCCKAPAWRNWRPRWECWAPGSWYASPWRSSCSAGGKAARRGA